MGKRLILLVNFAKQRNVKADTIATFIRRHPEVFEGHVKQQGNRMILDEKAEEILDEKYPMPKPVVIVNGLDLEEERELKAKLEEALLLLARSESRRADLEKALAEQKGLIESYESKVLALETQKDSEIMVLKSEKEADRRVFEVELDTLKTKNEELDKEIQRMLNRSLFERIFNK